MQPTPRMLEMRRRVHDLLSGYPDVLDDYLAHARDLDPSDETEPLRHPVLDSWVMLIRWSDLDPEPGEEDAALHIELHSGCSSPTRLGLALNLLDMER